MRLLQNTHNTEEDPNIRIIALAPLFLTSPNEKESEVRLESPKVELASYVVL
jgi:hypothetical protein